MPIYSLGDEGNKELVFGTGDIAVSSGFLKDEINVGVLVFNNQEIQPIGTLTKHKPVQEVNGGELPVRFVFRKIESVDVVISHLQMVKEFMLNNSGEKS